MTTYTLIAFTEGEDGWYDRCGDYNYGSPSALDISYFEDPKECGFMWAYTERQYETTKLLIDGRDPHGYALGDDGPWDGDEALIVLWEEAEKYREERSAELKAEHNKREQEKHEAEVARISAETAKRKAQTERIEREQLAELQRKYGGS